jgi:STE24 endopeptidase
MTLALLVTYLLVSAAGYVLSWLNIRHLRSHGTLVPAGFEGHLDPEILRKTAAYTVENNRVDLGESITHTLLVLCFLFGGAMGHYDRWIASLTNSFILRGILFFLVLSLIQTILDIPFSLYRNFSIESRYGFNTMTPRLWITDLLKSTGIGALLITLTTAGAFGLVLLSPHSWWLWAWGFFAFVTLFLMYLSPYVIEPLFYRFEPIRSEGLEEDIRGLMDKAGLEVRRVLQVDASRRSRHSNAYFTGIGRVKRIVLFDTLLERLDSREILAVLAHEAGHWKRHHLLKRLIVSEAAALLCCYLAFYLLNLGALPPLLGMETASFPAQLVILGFILSLATSLLTPLGSLLSRRQEREADRYAVELSDMPDALASSLIKMSRDNLSNLHPHPLYAAVYYSHPPMVERVRGLLAQTARKTNHP